MAAILVVAALTIPQIDKYMVARDGPNSLQMAGWVADRPYSPIDVLDSVYTHTPYQGPLYYLLLNQWGYLVGHEVALARVLSIFCGLLSIAMAYRIGRDAVSPLTGNFAVVIMASNAFYSFYLAHIRLYPMLVLLSSIVICLYFRVAVLERAPRRREYFALAAACAALASTHILGLLLYIVFAVYHLLFVRKGLRWLAVCAAATLGLALAGPHLLTLSVSGMEHFAAVGPEDLAQDHWAILVAWLDATSNGSPLLLLLAAAGAGFAWRQNGGAQRRCVRLFLLLLLVVAMIIVGAGIVKEATLRYLLAGFPLAVLFQAAGLYALYCRRKLLGSLVVLWVAAGLAFAQSADWTLYMKGRLFSYHLPPWHLVSRTAERSGTPAQVIAFMLSEKLMWSPRFGDVGLREYWFERRQIEFSWVGSAKWLSERARHYSVKGLSPWVVYQTSRIDHETVAELEGAMADQGYRACQRVSLPVSTEMARYRWVALDCMPARVLTSGHVAPMRYDFYGAALAEDASTLYFANRLTAESEVSTGRLKISHQLISEAWKNVGQLDMPLQATGDLGQYSMDVSQVPPGRYRLMAIVYDPSTGKTLDWHANPNEPPAMLLLQEFDIR